MRPSLAERIYALSLYLYPPSFRREFGEPMRQAFRDRLRDRRVPPSRFLFDITRDTVSTALREHAHSPQALLRMFALLALAFAAWMIAVRGESLRTALVDSIVTHQEAARKAAFHAYDRTVHDYTASIADLYAQRTDARWQLVAAQFYGADFDFFGIRFEGDDAATPSVAAQRSWLADVAIGNALREGWNDPVVLWNAVVMCPSSASTCRSIEARQRLQTIAADNGAVWWLELIAADRAKDARRARAAIERLADARDFTVYESTMIALWLQAYASITPPPALDNLMPDIGSADGTIADGLSTRIHYLGWTVAAGAHAFERVCDSPDEPLRDPCLRAARLLAGSDIFAARFVGLPTLARLDAAHAADYREAWRASMWSRAQMWKLLHPSYPDDPPHDDRDTQRWIAALRAHATLVAAADAITAASAQPLAPADWNSGWKGP
jgi:hypothetical protein